MNEYKLNNIVRMQEYWYALSIRQRIDIYQEVFDVDLRIGFGSVYERY